MQLLKDGMVIDALGVRSRETSTADLKYRDDELFSDAGYFFEATEIPPFVTLASEDEVRIQMYRMDGYYSLNGPTPESLELMATARQQILQIYESAELTI